jgi:hypothetical protein
MQAMQNFLGDSAANKYGRDAAGWESNIPLAGIKQPLFCKCRDELAGHLAFMLR